VLYTAVEGLRVASVCLEAVIPAKARELRAQLGLGGQTYTLTGAWGLTPAGTRVLGGPILFPKPETPKADSAETPATAPADRAPTDKKEKQTMTQTQHKPAEDKSAAPAQTAPTHATPSDTPAAGEALISIDDFARIDLRVAEVLAAEAVAKADKLLKLTVKMGDEIRTVVSGIRKWYAPEDLVGRKVILVANLKPAKLRGIESQGMILAAEDDQGNLDLVGLKLDLPSGTKVR
jgi:methionyl-tRNA synthetase